MSEQDDKHAAGLTQVPIVRDSTFFRFVSDEAVITTIGREVEVSFLQIGPLHRYRKSGDEFDTFDSETVLTEVARMRMGVSEMLGLAMSFLRGGIFDGYLKGEAIRSTLGEWVEQAADNGPETGND